MNYEYRQILTTSDIDNILNKLFAYADVLPEVADGCPRIVCVKDTGFYMLYEDANGVKSYKQVNIVQ